MPAKTILWGNRNILQKNELCRHGWSRFGSGPRDSWNRWKYLYREKLLQSNRL